jgi:hypothetical protein
LYFQLLPKNSASQIAVNVNRKKAKNKIPQETEKPGEESYRKHREDFTRFVTTTDLSALEVNIVMHVPNDFWLGKHHTLYPDI